jgi:hypothetical protein
LVLVRLAKQGDELGLFERRQARRPTRARPVGQASAAVPGKAAAPLGNGGDVTAKDLGDLQVGELLVSEQDDADAQDIALRGGMRLQGLVEVDQVFDR